MPDFPVSREDDSPVVFAELLATMPTDQAARALFLTAPAQLFCRLPSFDLLKEYFRRERVLSLRNFLPVASQLAIVAQAPFEPFSAGQLALAKGGVITDVQLGEPWCRGKVGSAEGRFPATKLLSDEVLRRAVGSRYAKLEIAQRLKSVMTGEDQSLLLLVELLVAAMLQQVGTGPSGHSDESADAAIFFEAAELLSGGSGKIVLLDPRRSAEFLAKAKPHHCYAAHAALVMTTDSSRKPLPPHLPSVLHAYRTNSKEFPASSAFVIANNAVKNPNCDKRDVLAIYLQTGAELPVARWRAGKLMAEGVDPPENWTKELPLEDRLALAELSTQETGLYLLVLVATSPACPVSAEERNLALAQALDGYHKRLCAFDALRSLSSSAAPPVSRQLVCASATAASHDNQPRPAPPAPNTTVSHPRSVGNSVPSLHAQSTVHPDSAVKWNQLLEHIAIVEVQIHSLKAASHSATQQHELKGLIATHKQLLEERDEFASGMHD